jgi:hypothetical protein
MKNQNSIVAHPIFGEGIIVATRWDEAEAQIAAPKAQLDKISSIRLLEAFRLGVVPHQDIEHFTFGRAYEIEELENAYKGLTAGKGGVCLIEGAYGSGKTHLLEYARHLSLKKGLVTAYCELSTQEGYEYHYRDLLRLMSGLDIDDHCFYSPVFKTLNHIDEGHLMSEVFWQWIEGESTKEYAIDPSAPFKVPGGQKIPALYDFSTAADYYSFILTGLSNFIYRSGMGGLVVIMDEVETVARIWEYAAYSRGLQFLEGLILSAFNDKTLKRIDKRLIHNRVRPTPYTYRDAHMLLILAMTPTHGLRGMEQVMELVKQRMFLRKFSKPELEIIYNHLIEVYKVAYPEFELALSRRDNVFHAALKRGSGELREFIKFSVEAFDWLRLGLHQVQKQVPAT